MSSGSIQKDTSMSFYGTENQYSFVFSFNKEGRYISGITSIYVALILYFLCNRGENDCGCS
jgi:hypothetical protein